MLPHYTLMGEGSLTVRWAGQGRLWGAERSPFREELWWGRYWGSLGGSVEG